MTQETIRKVWTCGIYNWNVQYSDRETRIANRDVYPRHNWADIDTTNPDNLNGTLDVFKKYKIDCVSQRCGKGYHVWGDLVDYPTWQNVWDEIRPFTDPKWAPHTLRMSKKRPDEVWERPIYHKNKNDPPKWSKAVMSFLCKALRNENSTSLWSAMHHVGIDKYFQPVVYEVEVKF